MKVGTDPKLTAMLWTGNQPAALAEQRLRVGWLIDGQGGKALKDRYLVVAQGVIQTVTPFEPQNPEHLRAVDFSAFTILPALMDAHVHLCFAGTQDPQRRRLQLSQTPSDAMTAIGRHMQQHADHGIVAVRDGGDHYGHAWQYKQQLRPCGAPCQEILVACHAWHAQGRYGRMLGRAPQEGASLAQAILAQKRGIDHLKLINAGMNSLDEYAKQTPPQFTTAELKAAVAVATSKGLPVMMHANGVEAVRSAIQAGCHSIEHGYFMGAANLARLAERQIYWVPTITPMAALARVAALTSKQRDVARQTFEHQMNQIMRADALGVSIALGTDAGSIGVDHGRAVWRELAMLVDAGLTLEKAVGCATLQAARLMRLEKRGALLPGWRADLLAVAGPP